MRLKAGDVFGDVLGDGGDAGGLLGIGRILPEHEAVILDRRAAARRGDDDGVEPLPVHLGDPGVDVALGEGVALLVPAHVMDERAAAPLPLRLHHLDAVAVEEPDGRLVEAGLEHRLGAAGQDGDAAPALALRP